MLSATETVSPELMLLASVSRCYYILKQEIEHEHALHNDVCYDLENGVLMPLICMQKYMYACVIPRYGILIYIYIYIYCSEIILVVKCLCLLYQLRNVFKTKVSCYW
jgi:hypothetical protein